MLLPSWRGLCAHQIFQQINDVTCKPILHSTNPVKKASTDDPEPRGTSFQTNAKPQNPFAPMHGSTLHALYMESIITWLLQFQNEQSNQHHDALDPQAPNGSVRVFASPQGMESEHSLRLASCTARPGHIHLAQPDCPGEIPCRGGSLFPLSLIKSSHGCREKTARGKYSRMTTEIHHTIDTLK